MVHRSNLTVRFAETDLLGHVNNSSYFIYLEQARVDFFNELVSDPNRWQFILASVKCDFHRQAYFNQTLTVETTVANIGNKSFRLSQPICDSDTGDKIAYGESAIVYFNFDTQKSEPIPDDLREKLSGYLSKKTAT